MDLQYGENQFFCVKQYNLTDGRAKGVHCIDVDLGDLEFTVIADRCLDIGSVKFCGSQIAFLSKNGVVSPTFYDSKDYGWLESFGGGLVVTCGLHNVGDPCTFQGKNHGLHGRISNIPAETVTVSKQQTDRGMKITVSGRVCETSLFGYHYELNRSIFATTGGSRITMRDRIINNADIPMPLMLLYHINFGYPLINPKACLKIPGSMSVEPFDENAADGLSTWDKFRTPDPGVPEEVFLHTIEKTPDGAGHFSLRDNVESPRICVDVNYSSDTLPYLGLWKSLRPGEYAVGLEPCNNHIRGVSYEHKNGTLQWLEPGKKIDTWLEFNFISSKI